MVSITGESNGRWTMISKPPLHSIIIIIIVCVMWNVNYTNRSETTVGCMTMAGYYIWTSCQLIWHVSIILWFRSIRSHFDELSDNVFQCNCLFSIQSKDPTNSVNQWMTITSAKNMIDFQMNDSSCPLLLWLLLSSMMALNAWCQTYF